MIDPNPNEEFPDRPDHPDFRDLSEIGQQVDAESRNGKPVPDVIGIDEDSFFYFMTNRIKIMMQASGVAENPHLHAYLMAVWADGVAVGRRYGLRRAE